MEKSQLVKIIVPVYKTQLNPFERISLEQNNRVLNAYPRIFIKPQSLDISELLRDFPAFSVESFDDTYFTSIQSYNRLMMSPELYQRFSDAEYMLLCQLDAYIFRDELTEWCQKGYDYIGAPWIKPFPNSLPIVQTLRKWIYRSKKVNIDYKVGNGGLSLRKINKHLEVVTLLQDAIQHYLFHTHSDHYNEDVFFATEVNKYGLNFNYPTWKEALRFSFDKRPRLCYQTNHCQLPFGCHNWYKKKELKFWQPIILPLQDNQYSTSH